jgi:hypothetical protein
MTLHPAAALLLTRSNGVSELETPAFDGAPSIPFNDRIEETDTADAEARPRREGLPNNFRMRADSHYVEQLTARAGSHTVRQLQLDALETLEAIDPDPAALDPLVASIREHGILQPLLVQQRGNLYLVLSGAKRLAAARACALTSAPCLLHEGAPDRAAHIRAAANVMIAREAPEAAASPAQRISVPESLLKELSGSLGAAHACLDVATATGGPLRVRMTTNILRVELLRARATLRALDALQTDVPLMSEELRPLAVLEQAFTELDPQLRASGVSLEVALGDTRPVKADRRMIHAAAAGMLDALLVLVQDAPGATLRVRTSTTPVRPAFVVELSQRAVAVPAHAADRFFDADWIDHPSGPAGAIWLAAARRIAGRHGGRVGISLDDSPGCTLTLVLPL